MIPKFDLGGWRCHSLRLEDREKSDLGRGKSILFWFVKKETSIKHQSKDVK